MRKTYRELLIDTIYKNDKDAFNEVLLKAYNREYDFGDITREEYDEFKSDMLFRYTMKLLKWRKEKTISEKNILSMCGIPQFSYNYRIRVVNKTEANENILSLDDMDENYYDCLYLLEDQVIDRAYAEEIANISFNAVNSKYMDKPVHIEIFNRKFGFGEYETETEFGLRNVGECENINKSGERIRQISNDIIEEINKKLYLQIDNKSVDTKSIDKLFLPEYTIEDTWTKPWDLESLKNNTSNKQCERDRHIEIHEVNDSWRKPTKSSAPWSFTNPEHIIVDMRGKDIMSDDWEYYFQLEKEKQIEQERHSSLYDDDLSMDLDDVWW